MTIHTLCVAHALASVLLHLCATKVYYIFNHHQKLGSAYVKPHIYYNMSTLQRIYNFKIKISPCVAANLQRLWFFPCSFHLKNGQIIDQLTVCLFINILFVTSTFKLINFNFVAVYKSMTFINCFMEINCSDYCSIELHSDPQRSTHLVLTQLTQMCARLHITECLEQ